VGVAAGKAVTGALSCEDIQRNRRQLDRTTQQASREIYQPQGALEA